MQKLVVPLETYLPRVGVRLASIAPWGAVPCLLHEVISEKVSRIYVEV